MHKKFGFWTSLIRANLAFLVISLLWGLIGYGFLSFEVSLALVAWSFLLGPFIITLTLMLLQRPIFHMTRLAYRKEPALQREYLDCLLRRPSLNVVIWVRPSEDLGIFWWESGFGHRSKTNLVVTTRWLRESDADKTADFRSLWIEISRMTPAQRLLRSYQIMMWWGSASLFDFFLLMLRSVLDAFNFSDFPSPAFWMQRFSWFLYAIVFGRTAEGELLPRIHEGVPIAIPRAWAWVSFGVWVRYPARYLHPTWILFTNYSAFIPSPEDNLRLLDAST